MEGGQAAGPSGSPLALALCLSGRLSSWTAAPPGQYPAGPPWTLSHTQQALSQSVPEPRGEACGSVASWKGAEMKPACSQPAGIWAKARRALGWSLGGAQAHGREQQVSWRNSAPCLCAVSRRGLRRKPPALEEALSPRQTQHRSMESCQGGHAGAHGPQPRSWPGSQRGTSGMVDLDS